jgi:3-deoxy-D-manno-octulosonate 8-phosphate phosphatase KdsC-like HAD superfamily phosphatase
MITGRAGPTIKSRADSIGVKVLQKPVEEDELVSSIEQARSK